MPDSLIEVDVVSDVVCPWCYVGKHFLDAAIAELRAADSGLAVRVRWHPYLLNPDTPPEGEPYRPFLERKFGGSAEVEAIWQRVREAGTRAGVRFAFEKIVTRPRTIDAHRLIGRAQANGDVSALAEALFVAHFVNGEDIGDHETLACIAAAATGERVDALRAFLASGEGEEVVAAEVEHAARIGVRGVPFFIFNQFLAVSGAQPSEVLVSAMREAMARPL
jgi:predicted DsbA family dithiol-disulfide isomerase